MISGTGMNPYFSSRKPLTSNQPSSGERNFETAFVDCGVLLVSFVCARTAGRKEPITKGFFEPKIEKTPPSAKAHLHLA